MRKIFAILILGIVIVTTACADNDVITRNLNELPAPARTILKQQFAHTKVSYIKIDKDWFKSTTYDVQLVNGTEVSFDSKGDWTEVDGKRSEVPAFFIPKEIKKQVNEMFPGEKITKTLNPQLHSRSATYIKRNGLLIRKITIKSSRPFQCAYHPLTP